MTSPFFNLSLDCSDPELTNYLGCCSAPYSSNSTTHQNTNHYMQRDLKELHIEQLTRENELMRQQMLSQQAMIQSLLQALHQATYHSRESAAVHSPNTPTSSITHTERSVRSMTHSSIRVEEQKLCFDQVREATTSPQSASNSPTTSNNGANNLWVWHGSSQEKLVPIRNSHKKKERPYDHMVVKLTNIK